MLFRSVFVGPLASVTTTATHPRISASGQVWVTSGTRAAFTGNVCYRATGGSAIVATSPQDSLGIAAQSLSTTSIPVLGTATPGTGTWDVGVCARASAAITVVSGATSGWVQVTP